MESKHKMERKPSHPGGILKRHYIEPLSLTVSEIAQDRGVSRKTVSKIVNERGSISPEMALRLAKAFNTSPELWLNMQSKYDLWMAGQNCLGLDKIKLLFPVFSTMEA